MLALSKSALQRLNRVLPCAKGYMNFLNGVEET